MEFVVGDVSILEFDVGKRGYGPDGLPKKDPEETFDFIFLEIRIAHELSSFPFPSARKRKSASLSQAEGK